MSYGISHKNLCFEWRNLYSYWVCSLLFSLSLDKNTIVLNFMNEYFCSFFFLKKCRWFHTYYWLYFLCVVWFRIAFIECIHFDKFILYSIYHHYHYHTCIFSIRDYRYNSFHNFAIEIKTVNRASKIEMSCFCFQLQVKSSQTVWGTRSKALSARI